MNYDPENTAELNKHWHPIDQFIIVVDSLISKITSHPDFYKKVIYNPNDQQQNIELSEAVQSGDSTKLYTVLTAQQKKPFYGYPADYGFLHDGRIQEELRLLLETLHCYKTNRVKKVRLEYE